MTDNSDNNAERVNINDVTRHVTITNTNGNNKRAVSACDDIKVEKNILLNLATEFQRSVTDSYRIIETRTRGGAIAIKQINSTR